MTRLIVYGRYMWHDCDITVYVIVDVFCWYIWRVVLVLLLWYYWWWWPDTLLPLPLRECVDRDDYYRLMMVFVDCSLYCCYLLVMKIVAIGYGIVDVMLLCIRVIWYWTILVIVWVLPVDDVLLLLLLNIIVDSVLIVCCFVLLLIVPFSDDLLLLMLLLVLILYSAVMDWWKLLCDMGIDSDDVTEPWLLPLVTLLHWYWCWWW